MSFYHEWQKLVLPRLSRHTPHFTSTVCRNRPEPGDRKIQIRPRDPYRGNGQFGHVPMRLHTFHPGAPMAAEPRLCVRLSAPAPTGSVHGEPRVGLSICILPGYTLLTLSGGIFGWNMMWLGRVGRMWPCDTPRCRPWIVGNLGWISPT